MDNRVSTGPPTYPQQPPPVQQKVDEQPPQQYQVAPQQLQQQQQFAQYPYPQGQVQPADSVPFSKPWHIAKLVLGSSSIVCSVVILGLGIYFLSTAYTFRTGFQFGLVGTAAAMALIWQTAEFITVCASSRHRGIHPGANVALHLLIWLVAIVATSFMAVYVSLDQSDVSYYSNTSNYYYYGAGELRWIKKIFAIEQAILAFTVLLLIIHFILFVRACIETHEYNKATRTVLVAVPMAQYGYYQAGPPQPQMQYGMQQMAPQQQQMPQQYLTREQMAQQAQQAQVYGYYAPPGPAPPGVAPPAPSHQAREHGAQPDSTVSSATPPPA